jgi:iron complex transport system substrate-binding protein
MPRIVSLIASATEIVCALGFQRDLVGRSHECDYPEGVRRLPVCTGPRFDIAGTSAEIDERVRDTLREGVSVYRVDEELLRSLRPEVIVTQAQCEVCAVSERDVREAVCTWGEDRPQIVTLRTDRLADLWNDIRKVADALGAVPAGETLVTSMEERTAAISTETARRKRVRVASVEWIEPLMVSGNWMPELIEMAGGRDLFGVAGEHAPPLAWEQFAEADPEVILVLPCGFTLEQTRQDLPLLTRRPGWGELSAVRNRQVFLCDGNQFFNRPGPRVVESLEILAETLHPAFFHFGHEGTGWERLIPPAP